PLSGLQALRFARNALTAGHAGHMVAGAVEELSEPGAWGWYRSGALLPGTALAEAGAVFALQAGDGAPGRAGTLGRLLACETGYAHGAGAAVQLAAVLARWHGPRAASTASAAERFALVTSLGSEGSVGCLVVARA